MRNPRGFLLRCCAGFVPACCVALPLIAFAILGSSRHLVVAADSAGAVAAAIALFGFQFTAPVIGPLPLAPLAILVAVWFGVRHGANALAPVALGTFPFWLQIDIGTVTTAGGVWPAVFSWRTLARTRSSGHPLRSA